MQGCHLVLQPSKQNVLGLVLNTPEWIGEHLRTRLLHSNTIPFNLCSSVYMLVLTIASNDGLHIVKKRGGLATITAQSYACLCRSKPHWVE